ncbi:uncharacterized protein PS065_014493 [Dugong dugon]
MSQLESQQGQEFAQDYRCIHHKLASTVLKILSEIPAPVWSVTQQDYKRKFWQNSSPLSPVLWILVCKPGEVSSLLPDVQIMDLPAPVIRVKKKEAQRVYINCSNFSSSVCHTSKVELDPASRGRKTRTGNRDLWASVIQKTSRGTSPFLPPESWNLERL